MLTFDQVNSIMPPPQVLEHSSDPEAAIWMAGWNTMRNAVLYLMRERLPQWKWGAVDTKQMAMLKGEDVTDSRHESVQVEPV